MRCAADRNCTRSGHKHLYYPTGNTANPIDELAADGKWLVYSNSERRMIMMLASWVSGNAMLSLDKRLTVADTLAYRFRATVSY